MILDSRCFLTLILVALVVVAGCTSTPETQNYPPSPQTAIPTPTPIPIVSTSFSDFGRVYCDKRATDLQKDQLFEEKFKNQYVKWSGTVSSVSESWGSLLLHVKHCHGTFGQDIIIGMNEDQKSKLVQLREGDTVTYIAKLFGYGNVWGLQGDDGRLV